MQQLCNNTWAFEQTWKKQGSTLNYSSIGTFSTANISMQPDAPTVPVAWQGGSPALLSAAPRRLVLVPMSQKSGSCPKVEAEKQPADH